MVDDRPDDIGPSSGPPDLGRPKRAPPTIDLDASQIKSETVTPADSTEMRSEASAPVEAKVVAGDPALAESLSGATDERADELPKASAHRAGAMTPVVISGVTGAMVAALILGVASYAGWPGGSESSSAQVSSETVDALRARVATLETRPAASSSSTSDTAIVARLDGLEKSLAALRSDIATLKSQSDRASSAISDLRSTPAGAAGSAADLTGINDRISRIERTAGALKTEAAQQAAKPADDTTLRRVVAASLLDGAVRQGEPYAQALAAAKPLAADAATLKPLDAFAAIGLPAAPALSRELLGLLPKLAPVQDKAATSGGGFLERLQAGAAKLVRIERTDAVAGDDRNAVISRITAAARSNDIASARREINALPSADRVMLQSWTDKVDARDAALAAARQFAADATAALSKPVP